MLPELARGEANKVFVIPSEFSQALGGLASRFADGVAPVAKPKPRSRGTDEIDARAAADAEEAAQAAREAAELAESAHSAGPPREIAPPPPEPPS
jgi:hypothetical protein